MKENRRNKTIYIKIMYSEPLLVPYILENNVTTFED